MRREPDFTDVNETEDLDRRPGRIPTDVENPTRDYDNDSSGEPAKIPTRLEDDEIGLDEPEVELAEDEDAEQEGFVDPEDEDDEEDDEDEEGEEPDTATALG
jgi:hypothetical protein